MKLDATHSRLLHKSPSEISNIFMFYDKLTTVTCERYSCESNKKWTTLFSLHGTTLPYKPDCHPCGVWKQSIVRSMRVSKHDLRSWYKNDTKIFSNCICNSLTTVNTTQGPPTPHLPTITNKNNTKDKQKGRKSLNELRQAQQRQGVLVCCRSRDHNAALSLFFTPTAKRAR